MARGEEHRGKRILANSAVMTGGQIVIVLIGLVLTPITISAVGIALFGAWGIITSVSSYIHILDPGSCGIVCVFGAMGHVRGDHHEMARLTSLGMLSWIALGSLGVPVMILAVPFLCAHLHVAGTSTAQLEVFFYFGYGLVIFNAMQAVLSGQLMAIGLLWVSTVIDVCSRVFFGVVLIVGFATGASLWALIIASYAQGIAFFVATFIVAWRRYQFPLGNPFALRRSLYRELFRFGGWAQVTGLISTLTNSTDAIVIGTFVSTTAAGVANIGARLARQIPYFATVPEATLPAMAAAQQAGEGPEGLARMSIRSNRISYLLATSIATLVLGAAPVLLALWIGRWYPDADLATCLIALSLYVSILGQTAGIGIYAMGRVGYGARARVAGFVVNLVVTLALVKPFGMPGVLVGTLFATIATNAYLQVRVDQLLGISQWRSVFSWLLPLLGAALPPILLDRLVILALPVSAQHHRGPAFLAFIIVVMVNYVAFVVAIRFSGFLSDDDVRYLRRSLPGPMAKVLSPRVLGLLVRSPKLVSSA